MPVNEKILPEELKETIQSLSRAVEVHEWSRGLAHDMRAPLSAVLGYLDLIRRRADDLSPHQMLRYAELSHEAALRVNQMVQDVLDVANGSEEGGLILHRQDSDIHVYFSQVINTYG